MREKTPNDDSFTTFRPPAVPLVVHDPYFSIWSMSDTLGGDVPRHWTGHPKGMVGMARVDGRVFRFMGLCFPDRDRYNHPGTMRIREGSENPGIDYSDTLGTPSTESDTADDHADRTPGGPVGTTEGDKPDFREPPSMRQISVEVGAMRFDRRLREAAEQVGGSEYALLVALAYRQAIGAHKCVAGPSGELLFPSKENFSNGCMGTVDVSYPSSPLFLLYNPEFVKGMLRPVLQFAASDHWPYPFAPHDVGRYPLANGQVYGAVEQERDRPATG